MKRLLALLLLAVALPVLPAQTLIVTPGPDPGSSSGQNYGGSLGLFFTVNPSWVVTVSQVGFWDYGSDGVTGATDTLHVAIFNNGGLNDIVTGTQMNFNSTTGGSATGTLDPGTYSPHSGGTGSGQFRLYTLGAPVTLTAGNYALVGWGFTAANDFAGQNLDVNGGGSAVANFNQLSGAMTLTGSAYSSEANAGTLPTLGATANAPFLAATFAATAIPEPATYAEIFGVLAFAVVTFRMLKRRRDLTI